MSLMQKFDKLNTVVIVVYIIVMGFIVCFGVIYDNPAIYTSGAMALGVPVNNIFYKLGSSNQKDYVPKETLDRAIELFQRSKNE